MTEKTVSIDLPVDDDGMLPRQCPHCDGKFGIHDETYEEEHYLNLRCPYCELVEEFDEFLTEKQAGYAEAVAEAELRRMAEQEVAEQLDGLFSGISSNDFLEVETSTDDIDFGEPTAPSPHLAINTVTIICAHCDFPFLSRASEDDPACPVCR